MIKAEIKMKDGTHIIIDGSEEEIKKIISTISGEKGSRKKAIKQNKEKTRHSLPDMLSELKEEGFFDKPKSLVEIKQGLAEKGFMYAMTTLSPQVVREVRKHTLGRIKIDKKWKYVRR
jgi:hypothetical protein